MAATGGFPSFAGTRSGDDDAPSGLWTRNTPSNRRKRR